MQRRVQNHLIPSLKTTSFLVCLSYFFLNIFFQCLNTALKSSHRKFIIKKQQSSCHIALPHCWLFWYLFECLWIMCSDVCLLNFFNVSIIACLLSDLYHLFTHQAYTVHISHFSSHDWRSMFVWLYKCYFSHVGTFPFLHIFVFSEFSFCCCFPFLWACHLTPNSSAN